MTTKTGKLAQLSTFSHVELKALSLAGLVFFEQLNTRRLIPCSIKLKGSALITAIINAGYALEDAIHNADDDALPGLMQAFSELAEGEVIHGE